MAGILGFLSKRYEPSSRIRHFAATIGSKNYIWGGRTKDFSEKSRMKLRSVVETFDPYLERWEQRTTKGAPPPGMFAGACTSLIDSVYICAGTDGNDMFSSLYELNTATLEWREPPQQNPQNGPIRKTGCRMVSYSDDTLTLFGGYDGKSLTNEFHLFNLSTGLWNSPYTSGTRPPPCANFSFNKIDHHRAVLFGGTTPTGNTNDLYFIDLQAMHWTKAEKPEGAPYAWPVRRFDHAACCLNYGSEYPQLLISGGVDADFNTLSDMWIFDVDSKKWNELKDMPSTRAAHIITSLSLAPGLIQVTVFGGYPEYSPVLSSDTLPKIAETTVLTLESVKVLPAEGRPHSKEWTTVSVTKGGELGLVEKIGEKMARISRRLTLYDAQATEERIMKAEKEAKDASDVLKMVQQEAMLQVEEAYVQISERDQRIEELLQQVEEAQQQMRQQFLQTEQYVQELRQQLQEAQQRGQLAEGRLAEAERRLLSQREEEEPFWVVQREEIELAEEEEELGRGGWAVVKIATFRGACVAAKFLHGTIVSSYNRQLFIREMNIASRVRHPNLLQFIGATVIGELVILTELMPTNLRAVMEERVASSHTLSHREITAISQDVARALNYLHLMKPNPIIHRDISSANVLLEPSPNESGWRAKVSDYGSANFLQQLRTAGPGNPAYAAPEANQPAQQSTKMDIFSLGVLMVEMGTCCFPDAGSREHHISTIQHLQLVTLIRQCLLVDKDRRPSAREVLAQLSACI